MPAGSAGGSVAGAPPVARSRTACASARTASSGVPYAGTPPTPPASVASAASSWAIHTASSGLPAARVAAEAARTASATSCAWVTSGGMKIATMASTDGSSASASIARR